jgi:hypothetical protein
MARTVNDEYPEVTLLLRHWSNGGSALPAVKKLAECGYSDDAAAVARLALRAPDCADREELEAAIAQAANVSDGWVTAIEEFAKHPSEERWEELMRFVPVEDHYQRLRYTLALLLSLHCDGNILFQCATKLGMTSDAFDLARSGTVDPEVIVARGDGSPARPAWLGLAALAAFARNDRWSTFRYLREASQYGESSVLSWASISEIRSEADEELNEELDRVGVPRV